MHICAAVELYRAQSQTAGDALRPRSRTCSVIGPISWLLGEHPMHRAVVWALLVGLVLVAVTCVGIFERLRLSTHVLTSPCRVVGSEILDVGTCTLCDTDHPTVCRAHPIATARLAVSYIPRNSNETVTGWVWYCKGRSLSDPCGTSVRQLDQMWLDPSLTRQSSKNPFSCTVSKVFAHIDRHISFNDGDGYTCYYSSRDPLGDVWLSMPSPWFVDHAWFEHHLEYPILLSVGGLALLSLLFTCFAMEGDEVWASSFL